MRGGAGSMFGFRSRRAPSASPRSAERPADRDLDPNRGTMPPCSRSSDPRCTWLTVPRSRSTASPIRLGWRSRSCRTGARGYGRRSRWVPSSSARSTSIGPVRQIVSPNKIHHLFLEAWATRWPDARLHAPPGLAVASATSGFTQSSETSPIPRGPAEIDQTIFRGSFAMEEVAFFHRPSRTAIVGDLVQRHDPARLGGIKRLLMRVDGLVGEFGSAPRELPSQLSAARARARGPDADAGLEARTARDRAWRMRARERDADSRARVGLDLVPVTCSPSLVQNA